MGAYEKAKLAWAEGRPWCLWRAPGGTLRTDVTLTCIDFPRETAPVATDETYAERVARALDAIKAGKVDKVVVARRETRPPADPILTLQALDERFPSCWLFALSDGDSVFLGATPELLLRVDSGRLETVALAGTSLPGDDSLLRSEKDRREHDHVVAAIRDSLEPHCSTVITADEPDLMVLPNVQHLRTPITATLREGHDPVDVVRALHPTPAVCGTPRAAARDLIDELEPFERGPYAGVIGLAEGDNAEYVVAIRSALLTRTATYVYAGAGIVEGSDPAAEDIETLRKLEAICDALRPA